MEADSWSVLEGNQRNDQFFLLSMYLYRENVDAYGNAEGTELNET